MVTRWVLYRASRRIEMVNHLMDAPCANDGEASTPAGKIPTEWFSPVSDLSNPLISEISLPVLAALCTRELDSYRRGEPCTDAYGLELLRRATLHGDQEAWSWVHQCFDGMVRGWLRRHPKRDVACRLESEENFVAQTFERFWQATAYNPRVEFSTLAAALQYLRASLHGALLDMLRAYARPRVVSKPVPGEPGEVLVEDNIENSEVWDILYKILDNPCEQQLAYLLFYCGLKPRQIVRFCPQEWSDVQEIYRLRCAIMERLVRNADHLR
jgi:hypothetical protein